MFNFTKKLLKNPKLIRHYSAKPDRVPFTDTLLYTRLKPKRDARKHIYYLLLGVGLAGLTAGAHLRGRTPEVYLFAAGALSAIFLVRGVANRFMTQQLIFQISKSVDGKIYAGVFKFRGLRVFPAEIELVPASLEVAFLSEAEEAEVKNLGNVMLLLNFQDSAGKLHKGYFLSLSLSDRIFVNFHEIGCILPEDGQNGPDGLESEDFENN